VPPRASRVVSGPSGGGCWLLGRVGALSPVRARDRCLAGTPAWAVAPVCGPARRRAAGRGAFVSMITYNRTITRDYYIRAAHTSHDATRLHGVTALTRHG
jgi:hypothetical protein